MSEIRTPGFCALCKSRCGAILVTRDGRFVGQEPNPDHPTGQALCVKGKAAPEIVYNPQRQLYPLRRTRPKGDADPGWVRISWDEALAETATRLGRIREESGPEAVAFGLTTPSGTPISDDLRWIERFINVFGSPNTAYGTEICNWHKDHAHAFTFGRGIASPDFEKTECVVLWGHNPSATWLDHATATAAARARGARLVVVDPRRAGFASRADQWLRVRPGADGLLALGIAGEMIRNGWYDADFMRDWSNGPLLVRADSQRFLRAGDLAAPPPGAGPSDLVALGKAGELLAYSPAAKAYAGNGRPVLDADVSLPGADGGTISCHSAFALYRALCEECPPERVEREAWVPADQVRATARLLFEARPVSYYAWSGLGQHTNATQTDRAVSLVMALTGSFDAPGGNVDFARPKAGDVSGAQFMGAEQRAKCLDLMRSPLGPGQNGWVGTDVLYDAILESRPYPIRALFGFGRNFVVNHADGARGVEALARLEFHVQTDIVMSPTAAFADIFLPVNTPWERESLRVGFEGSQRAENLIQLRPAVIESLGESRSDGRIVFELARRLGLGAQFWEGDVEAGFEAVLAPLGLSPAELRAHPEGLSLDGVPHYHRYRREGFKTPTGRIEVFSEALRDIGQDPLPRFVEPALSPVDAAAEEFPLVLTSAKVVHYCHGQHRHIPSLRRRSPDPEVSLHPDTAGQRGIADGDWVGIHTPHGRVQMRARLDAGLDPRVISAQYGWWQGNEALSLPAYASVGAGSANYNSLISDRAADPISGSTGLRSSLCEVVPIGATGKGWAGWRPFTLRVGRREARDIVSFELTPADGKALPAFRGGQHVTLRVTSPDGTRLVRCYSLSGPAGGAHYRISVKRAVRENGGPSLSTLMHRLEEGAPLPVELQAPAGAFHLAEQVEEPILLAGAGIGITPLLSMLHDLAARCHQGPVLLFHGVRSTEDHAFADEIASLGARLPGLEVTTLFSRNGTGAGGRVTAAMLLERIATLAVPPTVHLCGPAAMIGDVASGLESGGVPPGSIHYEAFGPSSRPAMLAHNGPQQVRLSGSGRTLLWEPGDASLLTVLEKAGAALSTGCRTGQCETCATRLIEGRVSHPSGSAEPGAGLCLPCVAIPLSAVTLDL